LTYGSKFSSYAAGMNCDIIKQENYFGIKDPAASRRGIKLEGRNIPGNQVECG